MKVNIPIPPIYVEMAKSSEEKGELLRVLVDGYVRRNIPGCKFIRIKKMIAECVITPQKK